MDSLDPETLKSLRKMKARLDDVNARAVFADEQARALYTETAQAIGGLAQVAAAAFGRFDPHFAFEVVENHQGSLATIGHGGLIAEINVGRYSSHSSHSIQATVKWPQRREPKVVKEIEWVPDLSIDQKPGWRLTRDSRESTKPFRECLEAMMLEMAQIVIDTRIKNYGKV